MATPPDDPAFTVSWWQPVLLAGLAGGMGWGIRGQYGHETGAMIAGALVSLVLVLLFCPRASALGAARAVAWGTIAIGFGGSMTYAQTVGLTQNPPLIGHIYALRWGMLGLAIKGATWIGFAGVFLGMALGGARYRPRECLALMAALLGLFFLGKWLINEPFDPAHQVLPHFYFSEDWRWQPGEVLKPRREVWGGLGLALLGVMLYARCRRGDRLALRLAGWGVLGGAMGFPLGQCLQAYHIWHPEVFVLGFWTRLDPFMNWWNIMETTFGTIMGGMLGLGAWVHRARIDRLIETAPVTLTPIAEGALVAVHVFLLIVGDFLPLPVFGPVADLGLAMGLIPIVAVAGGRWWPFLLVLPITVLPIAGKTIRQLGYHEHALPLAAAWIVYGLVPVTVATLLAVRHARRPDRVQEGSGGPFLRTSLLWSVWVFFGLNYAFFHFPWPWAKWTTRTPNAMLYWICAGGLTWAALRCARRAARAG